MAIAFPRRLFVKFTFLAAVVAAAVLTAAPALAQAPKTLNATVSETFTITAIDHTSRSSR